MAAVAENGTIGREGDLPWRLPADLRRFRSLTAGHHLLVGRRTWESIGRPLPDRRILVLTSRDLELPGTVSAVRSLAEGIATARGRGEDELFVAGGAAVYREALPLADRLYLTRVEEPVAGDVSFPSWDPADWTLTSSERPPGQAAGPSFRFEVWARPRT